MIVLAPVAANGLNLDGAVRYAEPLNGRAGLLKNTLLVNNRCIKRQVGGQGILTRCDGPDVEIVDVQNAGNLHELAVNGV